MSFPVRSQITTKTEQWQRMPLRTVDEGILRGAYNVARGLAGVQDTQPKGSVGHALGSWVRSKVSNQGALERHAQNQELANKVGQGDYYAQKSAGQIKKTLGKMAGANVVSAKKETPASAPASSHKPAGAATPASPQGSSRVADIKGKTNADYEAARMHHLKSIAGSIKQGAPKPAAEAPKGDELPSPTMVPKPPAPTKSTNIAGAKDKLKSVRASAPAVTPGLIKKPGSKLVLPPDKNKIIRSGTPEFDKTAKLAGIK